MDDLSLEEIASLVEISTETYRQRVVVLFLSGRATETQWRAMAEAVLLVSESEEGYHVTSIDRAVLALGTEAREGTGLPGAFGLEGDCQVCHHPRPFMAYSTACGPACAACGAMVRQAL